MKLIKHEGIAHCPPAQLFRLINLVENYPKFLSWCKETTIVSRNKNTLQATAFINKYGISFHCPFSYTLHSNNDIMVNLPSGGPFYSVSGIWRFKGSNTETTFSFELQLDYKETWWINFFLMPIIKKEVKNLIKAFEQRALTLK